MGRYWLIVAGVWAGNFYVPGIELGATVARAGDQAWLMPSGTPCLENTVRTRERQMVEEQLQKHKVMI
jgi:hypothetical protein